MGFSHMPSGTMCMPADDFYALGNSGARKKEILMKHKHIKSSSLDDATKTLLLSKAFFEAGLASTHKKMTSNEFMTMVNDVIGDTFVVPTDTTSESDAIPTRIENRAQFYQIAARFDIDTQTQIVQMLSILKTNKILWHPQRTMDNDTTMFTAACMLHSYVEDNMMTPILTLIRKLQHQFDVVLEETKFQAPDVFRLFDCIEGSRRIVHQLMYTICCMLLAPVSWNRDACVGANLGLYTDTESYDYMVHADGYEWLMKLVRKYVEIRCDEDGTLRNVTSATLAKLEPLTTMIDYSGAVTSLLQVGTVRSSTPLQMSFACKQPAFRVLQVLTGIDSNDDLFRVLSPHWKRYFKVDPETRENTLGSSWTHCTRLTKGEYDKRMQDMGVFNAEKESVIVVDANALPPSPADQEKYAQIQRYFDEKEKIEKTQNNKRKSADSSSASSSSAVASVNVTTAKRRTRKI